MKKQPTKYANIFTYTTKSGQKKYRVIITVNGVPVDKSGFNTINESKYFLLNIEDYITKKINKQLNIHDDLTFEQYFYEYEKKMAPAKKWSKVTRLNYEQSLKKVLPYLENKKLTEITKSDCQNILNDMAKLGYRKNSIKNIRRFVALVLNAAIKDEIITANKMSLTLIPECDIQPVNKVITTQDYITVKNYVLNNCAIPVKTFFLLCSLGMRKGEAIAISESKLTFFDDGTVKILINNSVNVLEKYGSGRTKTKQNRFVFGTQEVADALKECIAYAKDICKKKQKVYRTDTLLIMSNQAIPYHTASLTKNFSNISSVTGIKITPHMLRHYFATQSQLIGINPRLIADFLGHKNISMTDHYSHQTEDGTKLVLEKVQKLL